MWVPAKVIDWFSSMRQVAEVNAAVSVEAINHYREEVAALRGERDILKSQVTVMTIQSDWLRMQVNQLQLERAALLEKAYDIRVPAPQIARTPTIGQAPNVNEFSFEDMGDDLAKKLGLPVYGDRN